ncbi:GNAT family N-acetyltransferase [Nocardia terpenica]|uniref:N-acetyltransferase n=1 Tax=Nocardia terpenica TaxID=455432 RepID=A0A6G9ZC61_9NOCA|nr:GNAT family N-acetyltransferase [Nocardia terpenica]QIS22981.1 N-acetyltransferase [Nocardia terpenica]
MTDQAVTTSVVRNDTQHRYEVWYGDTLAGFAEYREHDSDTTFIHTEIDGRFGGKGLGGALARDAIEDAIARERTVVARCPFIKSWLDKHPEYDEHVVGKGIRR